MECLARIIDEPFRGELFDCFSKCAASHWFFVHVLFSNELFNFESIWRLNSTEKEEIEKKTNLK